MTTRRRGWAVGMATAAALLATAPTPARAAVQCGDGAAEACATAEATPASESVTSSMGSSPIGTTVPTVAAVVSGAVLFGTATLLLRPRPVRPEPPAAAPTVVQGSA